MALILRRSARLRKKNGSQDEPMDTDESNDRQEEATSVHFIQLSNGEEIYIQFFYKPDKYTLDDVKLAQDLDNYCVMFTRTSLDNFPTIFDVKFRNDQLVHWSDGNRETARLRIGPTLTQLLGDHAYSQRIVKYSRTQLNPLKVYVNTSERSHINSLGADAYNFTKNCGSRGIKVYTPKLHKHFFPSEVAALFSEYFLKLFYGGYKESRQKWVAMREVDADTIFAVICDMAIRHIRHLTSLDRPNVNWEWHATLLEYCDRFAFVPQFSNEQKYLEIMIAKLEGYEEGIVEGLETLSSLARDRNLLRTFMRKFCLVECLEEWENRYSKELSPEFTAIIAERKSSLNRDHERMQKLRLKFNWGSVEFSLLGGLNTTLVGSLIKNQYKAEYFGNLNTLGGLQLVRQLKKDETRYVGVFESPEKQEQVRQLWDLPFIYLMYYDSELNPQLRICERQEPEGTLVGVLVQNGSYRVGMLGPKKWFEDYEFEPRYVHTLD